VGIALFAEDNEIHLEITDDGSGFHEPPPEASGMGLHIMQHRAAMIGGQLTIQKCSPGTALHCRVGSGQKRKVA
jgi:signal transduction histidine kinase